MRLVDLGPAVVVLYRFKGLSQRGLRNEHRGDPVMDPTVRNLDLCPQVPGLLAFDHEFSLAKTSVGGRAICARQAIYPEKRLVASEVRFRVGLRHADIPVEGGNRPSLELCSVHDGGRTDYDRNRPEDQTDGSRVRNRRAPSGRCRTART